MFEMTEDLIKKKLKVIASTGFYKNEEEFIKEAIVLNISGFLLAFKQMRILNRGDILAIIRDLKEKDYYEFSEEERNRLINN